MILFLFAFAIVLFLVHQFWYRRRGLPNGPMPFPLIGNVYSMMQKNRWEEKLLEWRDQYGDIFTYFMGNTPFVSINDYKTAVEMFVKDGDSYLDRVLISEKFIIATRGGNYGVIDTSGLLWREQRRFTLRVLRDFGLGKNKMQERILEEVQTICENINRDIESGIDQHDFHKHTDLATGSVINAIVCGYRFSIGDKEKEFYYLKGIIEEMMASFSSPLFSLSIGNEFLASLPIISIGFKKMVATFDKIFKYLTQVIDEHVKQNDYTSEFEPRDYIDAYLQEMHRAEEKGESNYYSMPQLKGVVLDMWMARQETTSSTITWGIAYLIKNPEVQQKLHEEFDRVVKGDRLVTLADKTQLPYTNATIMEIQRLGNILSLNLPRKCAHDVEVNGFLLKKGTVVIPQISVMMSDPKVFKNPKEFNPSRFIDENGYFKPADEVLPFSLGKRQCLGEALARMELFLFIANFLNQYKFTPANIPPTLKKMKGGFSLATEAYKCRVEKRFK